MNGRNGESVLWGMGRVTQIRGWGGQATSWAGSRPSFLARLASWVLIAVLLVVLAVVMLPIAVIAIVLVVLWLVARALRRLFSAAKQPNGPLDGRRNVRVVTPRATEDVIGTGGPSEA